MSVMVSLLLAVLATLAGCAAPTPPVGALPAAPQAARTTITLLHVADLHAQLEPHTELFWGQGGPDRLERAGGLARLAAAIDAIRHERDGAVLTLDGGDTFHGSGAAALTEGEAVIGPLTALDIDVAVPGNWEVVYGPARLEAIAARLPWPMLATNIYRDDSGARLFAPWQIFEVGGVRVGVVGYTDPDVPHRQPPAYSAGLRYEGPDALTGLARQLRDEHDADVVVLLSHVGLSKAVELTRQVSGYDVHLSADTHERTYEPIDVDGTWVVEPGAFGSFMGRLDLTVEDGRVVDRRWSLLELTADAFPDEDPGVVGLVADTLTPLRDQLEDVVGHTEVTLARYDVVETGVDLLLADALRATTGTDIALSNGFRFGTPILSGDIVQADLWNVYPVVTRLKTGRITGAQLRDFWERELENVFSTDPTRRFGGWLPRPSGMTLTFEAHAPAGQRVRSIEVGGEPLDDERTYTITACEREGDTPDMVCRIPNVAEVQVHDLDAHEAVRDYLRKRGSIEHLDAGRITALDLPEVVRSQAFVPVPDHHGDHTR